VVSGQLSLVQAEEITRTEAACPGTEAELVALAKGSSLQVLRDNSGNGGDGTGGGREPP
jgi:hypothetical protein